MKRILFLLITLTVVMIPAVCYADSLDTTISGPDSVKAGETFTVTVNFSAGSLDTVNANVIYDDSRISYVSGGTSSGDGGIVYIKGASDDAKSLARTITFEAKAGGDANVIAKVDEAYDLAGNSLSAEGASIFVNVEASEQEEAEEPEEQEEEVVTEEEEEDNEGLVEPEEEEQPEEQADNGIWYTVGLACLVAVVLIILIAVRSRKKKNNGGEQ